MAKRLASEWTPARRLRRSVRAEQARCRPVPLPNYGAPCKNSGNVECRSDGGCLRCHADAGEACRLGE